MIRSRSGPRLATNPLDWMPRHQRAVEAVLASAWAEPSNQQTANRRSKQDPLSWIGAGAAYPLEQILPERAPVKTRSEWVRRTYRLPVEVADALQRYAQERRIGVSEALVQALTRFLS
ncbi:MAG: hypothetical protein RML47_02075 [Bacteroidota bacterium]|nr:hypothetical protein [Rhodothermia bacterium]MCS7155603.1 hypothetical protein [Bacteroidota bacterium]MDW8137257.1 hypothetical protein [Bacteroidota bacterium]MDW8284873.1 hypothetical protein [Bacteroidota bacterium]